MVVLYAAYLAVALMINAGQLENCDTAISLSRHVPIDIFSIIWRIGHFSPVFTINAPYTREPATLLAFSGYYIAWTHLI